LSLDEKWGARQSAKVRSPTGGRLHKHVHIHGPTLQEVLRARGLSPARAGSRAGIAPSVLSDAINGSVELSDEQVTALAAELVVPVGVLFSKRVPELFPPVDFRSSDPHIRPPKKGTLEAIGFVERLSNTFASLDMAVEPPKDARASDRDLSLEAAQRLAAEWRERWGLSLSEQLGFRNATRLYDSLRAYVEGLGVLVLHRSFGHTDAAGLYAQMDGGPHVIVINTTGSSKARKCFTLAHEFCHFLIRSEGTSNPSVLRNDVERFCNRFAAHLLAPDDLVKTGLNEYGRPPSVQNDFVRLFAIRLSISQEALVRRMVELHLVSQADYRAWRSQFAWRVPPGDRGDGGGGGPTDPLQTKRTTYGSLLIRLLKDAHRRGDLDEIEIYRLSGLKPKYQRPLFADA